MKITEVKKQALVEMYNKGLSYEKISAELGISASQVSRIASQLIYEGKMLKRESILITRRPE